MNKYLSSSLWLAFLLLPAGAAFAQQGIAFPTATQGLGGGQAGNDQLVRMNDFTGNTAMVNRNGKLIYGSPFADDRWLAASMLTTSNATMPKVLLKYDVLNKQLLMRPMAPHSDSIRLDDSQLISFELEEPVARGSVAAPAAKRPFRRFLEAPSPVQRAEYVEVLHQGKYELLKQYVKAVRTAPPRNGFETSTVHDEITDKPVYYICVPDANVAGSAVKVKLNQKAIQAAAPKIAAALATAPGVATAKTEAEWVAVLAAADPR